MEFDFNKNKKTLTDKVALDSENLYLKISKEVLVKIDDFENNQYGKFNIHLNNESEDSLNFALEFCEDGENKINTSSALFVDKLNECEDDRFFSFTTGPALATHVLKNQKAVKGKFYSKYGKIETSDKEKHTWMEMIHFDKLAYKIVDNKIFVNVPLRMETNSLDYVLNE